MERISEIIFWVSSGSLPPFSGCPLVPCPHFLGVLWFPAPFFPLSSGSPSGSPPVVETLVEAWRRELPKAVSQDLVTLGKAALSPAHQKAWNAAVERARISFELELNQVSK